MRSVIFPKAPCSKKDIHGDHYSVYHGDCIKKLNQLPEESVKLIFADPPYNLQLKQELYRPNQTRVDGVDDAWDKFSSMSDYDKFTYEWLQGCRRVMADDATIWVIGSYHNIFSVGKMMLDMGFWILNDVQWYKTNPMPNFRGVRFTNATETMIWAKKSEKQKKYTFNHNVMKHFNDGKQMTSVWRIPLCTGKERIKGKDGKKAHSTQKPEELLKRVILSSSNEGDLVLDPFAGSGTTCAMARKLGRLSVGIEREMKYLRIIKKRLEGINPDDFKELRLVEPEKRKLPKVSMEELVKKKYIKVNQEVFTKDRKHAATVLKDGSVKNGIGAGSIHKLGALLQNKEACNGWFFWYVKIAGEIQPIDIYRNQYRQANGLQAL